MTKINKKKLVYIIIIIILIILLLIFIYNKINKKKNSLFIENFNNNDIIKAFTEVYDTNTWGDNKDPKYKGSSGPGSALLYNEKTYIPFMNKFLKDYEIKSVVDLGCGDFIVGPLLYENTNINYTGYDAYKGVIDHNNDKFKDKNNFKFIHSDFTTELDRQNLKIADLCIIKDVLQHLPNLTITNFMDYIIKSKKYKYILLINCYKTIPEKPEDTEDSERRNINPGEFNSLSALRHPLKQYNAKVIYKWDTKEVSLIEI